MPLLLLSLLLQLLLLLLLPLKVLDARSLEQLAALEPRQLALCPPPHRLLLLLVLVLVLVLPVAAPALSATPEQRLCHLPAAALRRSPYFLLVHPLHVLRSLHTLQALHALHPPHTLHPLHPLHSLCALHLHLLKLQLLIWLAADHPSGAHEQPA